MFRLNMCWMFETSSLTWYYCPGFAAVKKLRICEDNSLVMNFLQTMIRIIYYIWVVVSNIFYFHPYLGKIPILTNIFQRGWNHPYIISFQNHHGHVSTMLKRHKNHLTESLGNQVKRSCSWLWASLSFLPRSAIAKCCLGCGTSRWGEDLGSEMELVNSVMDRLIHVCFFTNICIIADVFTHIHLIFCCVWLKPFCFLNVCWWYI